MTSLANKKIYLLLICFLSVFSGYAQTSDLKIDSLQISLRNIQTEDELVPLATTDKNYKEQEIEVSISFYISDPGKLKTLTLTLEKEKVTSFSKVLTFQGVQQQDGVYLTIGKRFFQVLNNKVVMSHKVPASVLKQGLKLTIYATDKDNKISNTVRTGQN
ncbi:MAG: hypothetical protein J7604_17590 [Sporocytophaga sp.]|uniref:hypothetical protein n=1 Tax=Sporocytophaga sp. TaxID=2231183 RepID=UPI001B1E4D0A|nr:hypothetical protein [Sporocytophaga sp.]MBO9702025.1 hypothetical protein [Sporocytophaga sp.]